MKELLLRTLTGILLIILIAGSILLGPISFLSILLVIFILAIRELGSLFHLKPVQQWVVGAPGLLFIFLVFAIVQFQWNPLLLLLPVALWSIVAFQPKLIQTSSLATLWVGIPLSCFLALGWIGENKDYESLIPLSVISLIWINDTFAYVIGSLMGKHRMTPKLSPGKSWEGFSGGIIFSLVFAWVLYSSTGVYNLITWFTFALFISCLALLGDLFESGLKRKKAVKNSGEILPGHGGILDRFDSLFFVAPGILVLLILLKLIQ